MPTCSTWWAPSSEAHQRRTSWDGWTLTLKAFEVGKTDEVRIVAPEEVPNQAWLRGTLPSAEHQRWGADLSRAHAFVVTPSTVSKHSWNRLFDPDRARTLYQLVTQERSIVDTRLNPGE